MSTCRTILSHDLTLWTQDISEVPKASLPAVLGSLLLGKFWDRDKTRGREADTSIKKQSTEGQAGERAYMKGWLETNKGK